MTDHDSVEMIVTRVLGEHRPYQCERIITALTDAGLLVEGETTTEWGVRVITEDRVWDDARRERSREMAEMEAGRLFSHLAPNGLYNGQRFVRAEVISRQRTCHSDHVTEWQPAKDGGDRV